MIDRIARLSWAERALLAEAAFWLIAARVVPFRALSATLEKRPSGCDLHRISWAIEAICRRIPFRCLEQSVAAKMMLRARGVPNTLYLGFARAGDSAPQAHAWLRSGSSFVTGGEGAGHFAVITTFSDQARGR